MVTGMLNSWSPVIPPGLTSDDSLDLAKLSREVDISCEIEDAAANRYDRDENQRTLSFLGVSQSELQESYSGKRLRSET